MFGARLSRGILFLAGWRVEGDIPADVRKFVVIAAPHTSGWDFPLGILSRAVLGRNIRFLGKKSLFKPPLGYIMRALGGYPVDRTRRNSLVDQVVEIFDRHEDFSIALAPEGTRSKVNSFKTGFYFIARGAGIPVIPVKFDYASKVIHFGEPFYPTDDMEADLEFLWNYFKGVKGRNPELGIS